MDEKEDMEKDRKPEEAPAPEPEKKPDNPDKGQKQDEKPKKSIYDQYRYWGSGNQGDGGGSFKGGGKKNRLALIALIILVISFVYVFMSTPTAAEAAETSYTVFIGQIESGNVASATIVEQNTVNYTLRYGMEATCRIPYPDGTLLDKLSEAGVDVSGAVRPTPVWYI